ncbi:MAG: hypothetical protein ACLQUY_21275 [Ktedonobacterales bacterium]
MAKSPGTSDSPYDERHASPEELAANVLDPSQLDTTIRDHIATCTVCKPEWEWMRETVQALDQYPRCPSVDALVRFALGESTEGEQLQVAAHLRNCSACTEEVEQTRTTLQPAAVEESPFAAIRRIIVTLSSQSQLGLALHERHAVDAASMETAPSAHDYTSDNLQISLSIESDGGESYRVSGDITPIGQVTEVPGVQPLALLYSLADRPSHAEPALVAEAPVTSGNFFDMRGVPAGSYRLEMIFGDQVIALEPVNVP